MRQRITNIRNKAKQHKTLIQNFSYLYVLQVFSMLIPFITYPFLIRILGKETFGLVIFAQTVVSYLLILVSFGFNITATQEISIHRDNKEKLNEIVSSVLAIKTLLFILAFSILCILLVFIPKAHGYEVLFILSMWTCVYDVIFPIWFFQGIEKMKYQTYITLIGRLLFLGLIFIFIHQPSDYLFFPILNGIGALLSGTISLIVIFKYHNIQFKFQKINTLRYYFKNSISIFISNISTTLYTSTSKIIIGIFMGMSYVAYYDIAEKIILVFKMPQSIFRTAIFSKISKERNIKFVRRIFRYTMVINILFYLVVFLFARFFVLIIGGNQSMQSIDIVRIIGLTIPLAALSDVFGFQTLIPFGFSKAFSKVIVYSALFYALEILILLLFLHEINLYTISIITVVTEIFIATYMYAVCKKHNLW